MKYNISAIDRELAKKMQSREGKELKLTLLKKIGEQEMMLDLFEKSINHCNQQIQYCCYNCHQIRLIMSKMF